MHRSGAPILRRALFSDGLFCVIVGVAIALAAAWLDGEVDLPAEWVLAAGIVTAVWGAVLIVASRRAATRSAVGLVAAVNAVAVVALAAWLAVAWGEMTTMGLVVAAVLAISVLRFAIYQARLLRR